jgi:uncharacterized membrane protein YdjX (TVP38/TMEM64 family)
MSEPSTSSESRARWIGLAALVAVLFVAARTLPLDRWIEDLKAWVDGFGPFGLVVFVAIYVVAAVLFVPGSALTIAAGAVFGLWWGTAAVSVASTTAAALAFLIARYVARGAVENKAAENPKFEAIDRAIGAKGWKIVALLRLSPAVPFSLGNYLYGLTAVRFWPYVLASWLAMLPGTFMYVYLGHAGAQGLQAASGDSPADPADIGRLVLLGVGLAATVIVTVYVTRIALRAIREQTDLAAS